MDDWMNVIAKRELTFEEIENLEKGLRFLSGKTKKAEAERERRLEQMRQTQQAQKQRMANNNVPSMVDLEEAERERLNLPKVPDSAPNLPEPSNKVRLTTHQSEDATTNTIAAKEMKRFKREERKRQNEERQRLAELQRKTREQNSNPSATTAPQNPVPLPESNNTPLPSKAPSKAPSAQEMVSTKINNAIAQIKSQIQGEQNRQVSGMEINDKKKNLDALNAKLQQLEAFKAKNKL